MFCVNTKKCGSLSDDRIYHVPDGIIELEWYFVNKSAYQVFAGLLILTWLLSQCAHTSQSPLALTPAPSLAALF